MENASRTLATDFKHVSFTIPATASASLLRTLIAAADATLDQTKIMGIKIPSGSAFEYGKAATANSGIDHDGSEDWLLPVGSPGILDTYVQALDGTPVAVKAEVYLGASQA